MNAASIQATYRALGPRARWALAESGRFLLNATGCCAVGYTASLERLPHSPVITAVFASCVLTATAFGARDSYLRRGRGATAPSRVILNAYGRSQVLRYARFLLPEDGSREELLSAASLLQEWATLAPDSDDAEARMKAMDHAFLNRPAWSEPRLSPAAFLDSAAAYYAFIAGAAAETGEATP